MNTPRKRIAVIGAGISGLAAAYFLNRRHDVVLFEAGSYLGGHANTVDIELEGQRCAVDTGFLVYNEKTYPNLIALFDELGVASIASDMSFGVSMDDGALEWAGTNLDTVFAQRRRWHRRPSRHAARHPAFQPPRRGFLADCASDGATLGQLLARHGYGAMFRDAYLLPMAAAIWSSSPRTSCLPGRDLPALLPEPRAAAGE
jgi:predicted NAD/FAD-binding protein